MNIKQNILIFSVFQAGLGEVNEMNHRMVLDRLDMMGIGYTILDGCYMGTYERSVMLMGFDHEDLVKSIVKAYNQECYLRSYGDRVTELVYSNRIEKIGVLVPVNSVEGLDSWTYHRELKQYFTVKGA